MKFTHLMDFKMPQINLSKRILPSYKEPPITMDFERFKSPTDSPNFKPFVCCDYPPKVLQNLNKLREHSSFCDVEIIAGDKIFKAHKAVLAASSSYFRAMFTGGLCESDKSSVELHTISPYIVEMLLEFVYSGRIGITEGNVQELMAAADMLELYEIVTGCTEFFMKELHANNAVGIYRFAEAHNCRELMFTALRYIQDHFPNVCNEDEIYELPKEMFIKLISSESLRVDSESQVFQAALRWIRQDILQRKRYVFEILKHVRIPLLSTNLLEKAITECDDSSLHVALKSVHSDLVNRKGCLVPLVALPRKCAKKDIFIIGGSKRELNTVWDRGPDFNYVPTERFDTFKREWFKVPNMNTNRIVPGVASLNGCIYVIGGEQGSSILACGECFHPEENLWTEIADMLRPRCEFGLCALDGYLYAMGGWIGGNIGGHIERYDPQMDCWSEVGELPEPRFSMGVVSYEGLIYLVGGCSENTRLLQDLLCYNPKTNTWRTLPPMSIPRSQMGVAVIDDFLYVVGGTYKDQVLDSVERYSFKKNKWVSVPPMVLGRSGPAVAALDGILYVIGGLQPHGTPFYRAQFTLSSVECYNPSTRIWGSCPDLPESRAEAGAVVV